MENRKLYKSRTDRVISGVCGGLGEHFGVDPIVIRLIWAVAVFMGGVGALLYIIAMIVIPEEPKELAEQKYNYDETAEVKDSSGKVGILLVIVGAIFLFEKFVDINIWKYGWPVLLIALGLFLIGRSK